MILNNKNLNDNSILFTNIVFSLFPISFIFGNLITNINLVLFCILGVFHLRKKILTINYEYPVKIIFLLFFVIFFSTSFNFIQDLFFHEYEGSNLIRLIKSITFFRFFILLIIIYLLNKSDILNFKYFFLTAALSPILVSLDVIYQYIFDFNIIGLQGLSHYNSGFFGDELIAGGFIQRFSFFTILLTIFLFKKKNNFKHILVTFLVCLLGMGIFLSGNRMPLVLFLVGLLLIFLFYKKSRIMVSLSFIILFFIIKFLISSDEIIKIRYISFYENATNVLTTLTLKGDADKNTKVEEKIVGGKKTVINLDSGNIYLESTHKRLFLTALDVWRTSKIIGNGIKSFRVGCVEFQNVDRNRLCSNHPHNYYFEILTDTGVLGFLLVIVIALLFIIFVFKSLKIFRQHDIENLILLSATISIILEVFPFKSTGSLFTTNNATYLILISAIILSHKKLLGQKNT